MVRLNMNISTNNHFAFSHLNPNLFYQMKKMLMLIQLNQNAELNAIKQELDIIYVGNSEYPRNTFSQPLVLIYYNLT